MKGANLLVLLAIADRSDDRGNCWPSVEELALRSRTSRRQVSRILKQLVDSGELHVPAGPRSRQRPYRINVERFDAAENETQLCPIHENLDETPTSDPMRHPRPIECDITMSLPLKETPRTINEPPYGEEANPVADVWEHYKRRFPNKRLQLNDKRRKIIRDALKVRSVDCSTEGLAGDQPGSCKEAIDGLAISPHHKGQNDRATVYDDIRYALKGTGAESNDERIDKMSALARRRSGDSSKGQANLIGYLQFLDSVPSGQREIVRAHVNTILECQAHIDNPILAARSQTSERWLRESLGVEVIRSHSGANASVDIKRIQ